MPQVIILDTFPLSSTAKREPPLGTPGTTSDDCRLWVQDCLRAGNRVITPAITYYETLRELERLGASSQIARLRAFCRARANRFLSLTDADIDRAARLWATARNAGKPTASPDALDGDVILAAQALGLGLPLSDFVVATTNVGHLSQFVPAALWTDIVP